MRRIVPIAAGVVLLGVLAWGVTKALERLADPRPAVDAQPEAGAATATAHITATIFFASEDGQALIPVQREVPLAEGVVEQGREIMASQLLPMAPAPYLSVIPPGTTLRAFYVTERGDAFVDLSQEVSSAHPGGSLTELLTVHAIVNAVTTNLPAIQRVQILVNGKEVDTIAGHVDIRRPLTRDTSLVREPATAPSSP